MSIHRVEDNYKYKYRQILYILRVEDTAVLVARKLGIRKALKKRMI